MSGFTPGPWVADLGEAFHIREQDGGRIAQMVFMAGRYGGKGRRNPDEVAASARLIAAAPDLLDALDRCLNFIANTESELGETLDCGDKARAAIAKAKGGAA